MLKNAGIKSREEAVSRLEAGEIFYYDGEVITYDEAKIYAGLSPFRYGSAMLYGVWCNYESWKMEVKWESTVSRDNPVLCWCWGNRGKNKVLALVVRYDADDISLAYRTDTANWYENAVPATRSEIEGYYV